MAKSKVKEKHWYSVRARVVLAGAHMMVEAESEDQARDIAARDADFDWDVAEMVDWTITGIRQQPD